MPGSVIWQGLRAQPNLRNTMRKIKGYAVRVEGQTYGEGT
jgi:hypothetical protein